MNPGLAEGEPWTQVTSKEALLEKFEGWDEDTIGILKVTLVHRCGPLACHIVAYIPSLSHLVLQKANKVGPSSALTLVTVLCV